MCSPRSRRLLAALVLSPLLACTSSDGTGKLPNLTPTSVEVLSAAAEVQAAHALDVRVGISADQAVEGVGVVLRALPQAQFDAHVEDPDNWVLGGGVFDVPEGGGTFTLTVELPYDLPAGAYYVIPEVDPLDVIEERDETDQWGVKAALTVADAHRDEPRLYIEAAALDTPTYALDWEADPAAPLGLSLRVGVEANPDVEVDGAELTACLRAPGADTCHPLGIWDSAAGGPAAKAAVAALVPGAPTSVHLDLHLGPELAAVVDGVAEAVAADCLAGVAACAATHGLAQPGAQACVDAFRARPLAAFRPALRACLLELLPFTVLATLDKPGATLYEPAGATPGRTAEVALQLLAAVTPTPEPEPVPGAPRLTIVELDPVRPTIAPVCVGEACACEPRELRIEARKDDCAEPITWSVRTEAGYEGIGSEGVVTGADTTAFYTPQECSPALKTRKVVVEGTACGATTSLRFTIDGTDPAVTVTPAQATVVAGAAGALQFQAALTECVGKVDWALETSPELDGRFLTVDGELDRGTVTVSADGLSASYRPPRDLAYGPAVPVRLRATAPASCNVSAAATISVGLVSSLGFEKAYRKYFDGGLFGAGIDLYAGAFLRSAGGIADAHARVPVKVFGQAFDVLDIVDHASVDPRPAGVRHLTHSIEAFGLSVDSLTCPGSDLCTGEVELWSDSKCLPPGPPKLCLGDRYDKPCTKSSECSGGLTCKNRLCTKKCDTTRDCGDDAVCSGDLPTGSSYKQVIVIVIIPVTIEGKLCAEYGAKAKIDLLTSSSDTFGVTFDPYFELNGYASAAIGYSGIFAVGIRGELVLLREDFTPKVEASIVYVTAAQDARCPVGCIQGRLRESVENNLEGGSGQVYLFADYPTLKWCRWYPCFRIVRSTKTLASWGSWYHVANACDWCDGDADCGPGVSCVGRQCDDGRPGLLCKQQGVYVSAE